MVDGLINRIPKVGSAREALITLIKMGPPERTQRWFLKQIENEMSRPREPLKHVRTFQAHGSDWPWRPVCGRHDAA